MPLQVKQIKNNARHKSLKGSFHLQLCSKKMGEGWNKNRLIKLQFSSGGLLDV